MNITKWKKPIWKGYTLYDSNHITLWQKQNYGDNKKNQLLLGVREKGGMARQSTEDFQESVTILYDTMIVGTCHYIFVQTHRMYHPQEWTAM